MPSTILSLTNVINVTVQGTPTSLTLPNVNTVALFSQEIPENYDGLAYKIYTNPTDVATDWGSSSNAYSIATSFFAQQPNPLQTGGYLVIIPRLQTPSLESTQDAIARTINLVYYFGILVDEAMSSTPFLDLAEYVQSIDKMFFYASIIPADYAPGGILDQLRTQSLTRTRGLYYNDGVALDAQKMAAAYSARGLSTDFTGSNTTQTMHLKTLAGFDPDFTIDQTQLQAATDAGVDVYVNIAGVPSLFTSGENQFFDEVYNELWFKFALETAGFNFLRQTSTKIPQTDYGMEALKNVYRSVCAQAVNNGFIGPGAWTSPDVFGNPANLIRSVADVGFYVYSQPVALQSQANREARIAPLVQIAVKAQGAIQKSNILVNVNL